MRTYLTFLKFIFTMIFTMLLFGCAHPYERQRYYHDNTHRAANNPPNKMLDNICEIYQHDSNWERAAQKSYRRWGTPDYILMAIVHQESKFKKYASPRYRGAAMSSAYGYSQAQPGTWREYQRATFHPNAQRTNIYDSLDFMGWYNSLSHQRNHIAKTDAKNLYLAYHEGNGGYANRTYKNKRWLIKVANRVQNLAAQYKIQLRHCH
jgi:hypothetical protein